MSLEDDEDDAREFDTPWKCPYAHVRMRCRWEADFFFLNSLATACYHSHESEISPIPSGVKKWIDEVLSDAGKFHSDTSSKDEKFQFTIFKWRTIRTYEKLEAFRHHHVASIGENLCRAMEWRLRKKQKNKRYHWISKSIYIASFRSLFIVSFLFSKQIKNIWSAAQNREKNKLSILYLLTSQNRHIDGLSEREFLKFQNVAEKMLVGDIVCKVKSQSRSHPITFRRMKRRKW